MKILLYDENYGDDSFKYMQPLMDNIEDLDTTIFQSYQDAKDAFLNYQFDFLIIDFSTKNGKALLDYILIEKPQQRIITIAYELSPSESNCDSCMQNFQKRRLIKPIKPLDVYNTIINFDKQQCQFAHHFNDKELLVENLTKRYTGYTYDKELKQLKPLEKKSNLFLREYLNLSEELEKYNIPYTITGEYTLQLK